ncbi:hypothetical protein FRB93_010874 [Tulasnella sp. JGI-2019a]|nr:hypothetical protein FRB93_010874 [Tulasnella sp. JGI-2019a]
MFKSAEFGACLYIEPNPVSNGAQMAWTLVNQVSAATATTSNPSLRLPPPSPPYLLHQVRHRRYHPYSSPLSPSVTLADPRAPHRRFERLQRKLSRFPGKENIPPVRLMPTTRDQGDDP